MCLHLKALNCTGESMDEEILAMKAVNDSLAGTLWPLGHISTARCPLGMWFPSDHTFEKQYECEGEDNPGFWRNLTPSDSCEGVLPFHFQNENHFYESYMI